MSSWLTLNIEGVTLDQLPDAFADWHSLEEDGRTVVYSFNPGMSPGEAAAEAITAGDHPVEPVATSVLTIRANDTSDFVTGTIYWPGEVKWNAPDAGLTWSGHHYTREDSEFLANAPDIGHTPNLGGNWSDE